MNGSYKKVTLLHTRRRKEISVIFFKFSPDYMLLHRDKFWSILELWFLQVVLIFTHYIAHNNH